MHLKDVLWSTTSACSSVVFKTSSTVHQPNICIEKTCMYLKEISFLILLCRLLLLAVSLKDMYVSKRLKDASFLGRLLLLAVSLLFGVVLNALLRVLEPLLCVIFA